MLSGVYITLEVGLHHMRQLPTPTSPLTQVIISLSLSHFQLPKGTSISAMQSNGPRPQVNLYNNTPQTRAPAQNIAPVVALPVQPTTPPFHMATIHSQAHMDHLLGTAHPPVMSGDILNMDRCLDMHKLLSYHLPQRLNIQWYQNGLNIATDIPMLWGESQWPWMEIW